MTNNELVKDAEKVITKIVNRRLACLDVSTRQEIIQTTLIIFWKRNKHETVVKRYVRRLICEACRNLGLFKFRVSKEVTDTEDGVVVEEVYQARTKKQQAKDNAETLCLDDCLNVSGNTDNARMRLFDHMAKDCSRMMRDVIARITKGEAQEDVADSYKMTWQQVVYKLAKEAGNVAYDEQVGQMSLF